MEKTKKLTIEKSTQEINEWLDYKNVRDKKREGLKEQTDNLADAISDGILVIDADKNIIHTLQIPVGEEIKYKELKYKPRLSDKQKIPYMKGVSNTDSLGMIHATIAALTETPRAIISALDTEDMDIARSIAIFFI